MSNTLLASDDYVDSFPLMSSPFPLLSIFVIYLWLVMKAGPDFMKNRKPYKLFLPIRLYNIFQVVACTYFISQSTPEYSLRYTWQCLHVTMSDQMTIISWFYLLLRLAEFVETIFFVLRKKQNQVSTLHVYHHISTAAILWMFLKYSGGKLFTLQTTLDEGVLKSLITFRRHWDDHSCYQHIRAHLYVQLLLPELVQAVDEVHKCREAVADGSSNSSACGAAWAVCGWRLAGL